MTASEFRTQLEKEGIEILEFWMKEVIDIGEDFIWGQVHNDNSKDRDAPVSGILAARLVWTFSRAYTWYGYSRYLEYAEFCYNYFIERFWDHKYGGVFWEVSPQGEVTDTRKQLYVQAFALYALSEFYAATKFEDALEKGVELFNLMQEHGLDTSKGGYIEACLRNWEPAGNLVLSTKEEGCEKTMNTHLHIMEAYANLLNHIHTSNGSVVHPAEQEVWESLHDLLIFILDTIYNSESQHLDLYFTGSWELTKREYSPGHDIEAAWLLNEAVYILNETASDPAIVKDLTNRVRETAALLIDKTLETGMRKDGSLITEFPAEEEHTGYIEKNRVSEWWPQAEAWTGFLEAFTQTKDEKYMNAAQQAFTWVTEHLKDRARGEWLYGLNEDGSISMKGKAGFWKCPYHSWRGCSEGIKRLKQLA